MKNLVAVFTSIVMLLLSGTAFAWSPPKNPWFVGGSLGDSTIDLQSHYLFNIRDPNDTSGGLADFERQDSQALSILANGGFYFYDWMAVEMQVYSSMGSDELYGEVRIDVDGTVDNFEGTGKDAVATEDVQASTFEVSSSAVGVFALFQIGSEAYAKGRIGVASSTVDFETDAKNASFSTAGIAYGVTLGQKLGPGALEVTYMRYPDVKVDQSEFISKFASQGSLNEDLAPIRAQNTGIPGNLEIGEGTVTVRRRITSELLTFGYVYRF